MTTLESTCDFPTQPVAKLRLWYSDYAMIKINTRSSKYRSKGTCLCIMYVTIRTLLVYALNLSV